MNESLETTESEKELQKVVIEEYSDDYKEQARDLIFDVYENEMNKFSKSGRLDLNNIQESYQKGNGNFWVALYGGKVVGTIGLTNQGEGVAGLHRFCVAKEFRGKGLSGELFHNFIKFALAHGYKKVFLGTWEGAKAANNFYVKNGFERRDSIPEGLTDSSRFINDKVFYELDLSKLELKDK
jgi:RimJ/RimL family protein N-acetyltransferase